ncbi:MAG: VWA domain-containing protein [Clostridia bacterium]|nr:VWA domain-containing protein [Clostridia bacterium]
MMKRVMAILLTICFVFGIAACANIQGKDDSYSNGGEYPAAEVAPSKSDGYGSSYSYHSTKEGTLRDGDYGTDFAGGVAGEPSDMPGEWTEYEQINPRAGLITASAWNENVNYDFWRSLFKKGQSKEENGKFVYFYEGDRWGFDSTNRVKVTVKVGETPVAGAKVVCLDNEGEARFAAVTGSDGVAYLFPEISEGRIKITSGDAETELSFDAPTCELVAGLNTAEAKKEVIKMMLLIDATGSMGDELNYLRAELLDVIERVATKNDGVRIDLAILFYRDDYDEEKFAYYDFVNVTDQAGLEKQIANLKDPKNDANGGDDIPEAVDEALQMAVEKDWGDDTSTKIVFHLLDAPPHTDEYNPQRGYEKRFENAVRLAAEKGIRLCPILCSGADELCEYLVRQEAIYTGGTFIFVTDDSGIGGEHLDPDIPDAVVENLNDLMVRLINGYYTGTFAEPVEWNPGEQPQQRQEEEPLIDTLEPDFVEEAGKDGDNEVVGHYIHSYSSEAPEFSDSFSISLNEDGTFSYYETVISSHIGMGNYTVEDGIVTLTEAGIPGFSGTITHIYKFRYEDGKLIYLADQSNQFMYVTLSDGTIFKRS